MPPGFNNSSINFEEIIMGYESENYKLLTNEICGLYYYGETKKVFEKVN